MEFHFGTRVPFRHREWPVRSRTKWLLANGPLVPWTSPVSWTALTGPHVVESGDLHSTEYTRLLYGTDPFSLSPPMATGLHLETRQP
jgi:hypothetical protein